MVDALLLIYNECDFQTAIVFPLINKFYNSQVSLVHGSNAASVLLQKFDKQFVERREFKLEFKTTLRDEFRDFYQVRKVDREWVIASPCVRLCPRAKKAEPSWIGNDEQTCFVRIKTNEWKIKSASIKLMKLAAKRHRLCNHEAKLISFAKEIRLKNLKSSLKCESNLKRFRVTDDERSKRKNFGDLISLRKIYLSID